MNPRRVAIACLLACGSLPASVARSESVPASPTAPNAPFRASSPPPAATPPFVPNRVHAFRLSNGIQVYAYPEQDERVAVTVSFDESDVGHERRAIHILPGTLFNGGTAHLSTTDLRERKLNADASVDVNSSMDDVRVTAVCPASRLTATLELLHAAILDAALTEATVTYARTRRTTWLDTLFATDPSRQALFRHEVLLWGATSPYGMEFEDTAADARSVTLDQVQKALTLLRDPKRTVIAIAGGYDDATLPRLVEGAFGSMAAASLAPAPVPNASIPRASRQVVLLDRSGAVTARIRVGASSAPINETDGFALLVLSQIVGSLDYGRLQARLRRELHLTDKVGSERFAGRMGDGFVLTAEVPTSAAGQTLHEIELLAKALIEHDVGADELGAAKERLVAEEAGSFERVRDVAGVMLSVNAIGLDPDTRFQTYAAKLAAIGSGDIRRVAERFLAPSAWKVVVIGDAATIRPELVRVGYPPDAR